MVIYFRVQCLPLTFLLTISICSWTTYAQIENTGQPEVTILQGTMQGITITTKNQRNVSGFLGIPFAQPPVGNLRFASPVAAGGWNGTLNASVDGNMCPQITGTVVTGEEDCLYLNVYTPQLPVSTNSSLLPVMVYIYGGAFVTGSSKSSVNGPKYILDHDVVLVVANYRLGALGFLSTGDEVASGNWALKDQVLALKWVQDNIKYFGGDPGQVTLFGISAGSACLHLLTLSPSTTGLFHKYITQSGSALSTWAHQPRAAYANRAFELGEYVGCSNNTSDSLIQCLRTVNFSDILTSNTKFLLWRSLPSIIWSPTDEPDIEGAIITDSPTNLFAAGKTRDLPWISGVVRDEGLLHSEAFYDDDEMLPDFLENFEFVLPEMLTLTHQPDSGAAWTNAMKSYYFNDLTANTSVLLSNLTTLISDALFFYPAYNAFQQQFILADSPQYFYTFNYRGTNDSLTNHGVPHGQDAVYLFPRETVTYDESDLKMVDAFVRLFTSFAISGIPTISVVNGSVAWERYSIENNYLQIGNESDLRIDVIYSFHEERMQFWDTLNFVAEEPIVAPDTSHAVAFYPNLFIVLLLACWKNIFTAARL